jgi:hypothetical protein
VREVRQVHGVSYEYYHVFGKEIFLWLLAGMLVLIVSVIWGINELMAWMNGK